MASLAAVALVASGQVKAPRASQFVRGRKRRQQRRRGATLLILPLAFPFLAFFFLVPTVLWDIWHGMFFRPVDPEPRTRGKKGRFARGSNVLSCCSVTFFGSTFFLSISFSSTFSQASRASSELDEAYASVYSWIDEVSKEWWKEGEKEGRASAAIELDSLTPTSTTNKNSKHTQSPSPPRTPRPPPWRAPRPHWPLTRPGR